MEYNIYSFNEVINDTYYQIPNTRVFQLCIYKLTLLHDDELKDLIFAIWGMTKVGESILYFADAMQILCDSHIWWLCSIHDSHYDCLDDFNNNSTNDFINNLTHKYTSDSKQILMPHGPFVTWMICFVWIFWWFMYDDIDGHGNMPVMEPRQLNDT